MDENSVHDQDHHHGKKDNGLFGFVKTILTMGHSHDHQDQELSFTENTEEGIKTVKISFAGLMITALFQVIIVYFTGSISLLADTIHNFSDALTAIPLFIAYKLSRKKESKKYSHGYGRAEDLAGLFIVLMIALSAGLIFFESIKRIINPVEIRNIGTLALAGIIGFIGNEAVAQYRITKGRQINSEALVADGMHARTDGLTSLSILFGAAGAALGYPIVDAIVGIVIGIMILFILYGATEKIFLRLLDAVDPRLIEDIDEIINDIDEVISTHMTKARHSGRLIYAQTHIVVSNTMTIIEAHDLIERIEQQLSEVISNLGSITIHVDPESLI